MFNFLNPKIIFYFVFSIYFIFSLTGTLGFLSYVLDEKKEKLSYHTYFWWGLILSSFCFNSLFWVFIMTKNIIKKLCSTKQQKDLNKILRCIKEWFNSRPSFETLQELKNFNSATERTLDFGNIVVDKMKNSLMYYSKKINRNKIDKFLFSFCWHELKNDFIWNYIIKQKYDKQELSFEMIDLFDRTMSECFQFVFGKL